MTDTPTTSLSTSATDFVRTVTAKAQPHVRYTVTDLTWAITHLVRHLELSQQALSIKIVFHPRTIDTFITTALPNMSPASTSNMRSILLRMSEVLLGERAPRVQLTPISASDPSVPYVADETKAFRGWASRAQVDRRTDARVLLALGFGAGLSGGEIANVRVAEVAVDGATVTVTGPRSRTIRVDTGWTRQLAKAVAGRDGNKFMFCPNRDGASRNLVNNFIARTRSSSPGPNSQRMRATWIVAQLDDSVTATVLLDQAGVRNLSALGRYMPFAKAA